MAVVVCFLAAAGPFSIGWRKRRRRKKKGVKKDTPDVGGGKTMGHNKPRAKRREKRRHVCLAFPARLLAAQHFLLYIFQDEEEGEDETIGDEMLCEPPLVPPHLLLSLTCRRQPFSYTILVILGGLSFLLLLLLLYI